MDEFRCEHGFYGDGCEKCQELSPLSSHAVLGDGWRDARKELPDASGDCIVYTLDNRIEIDEYTTNFGWYIDRVGGKVIAWMPLSVIGKPAFA
jgi:hypothetical protein